VSLATGSLCSGVAPPALETPALPPLSARYGAVRVLVADDSRVHRLLLAGLLESIGCEVLMASDGEEVLAVCEQDPLPDVILMDCAMPGMDGFEAAVRLRARFAEHYLPVIFVTGSVDPATLARAYAVGGDTCLGKPLNPLVLHAKLRSVLEVRRLNESLRRQRDELATLEAARELEFDQAHRVLRHILAARECEMPNVRQLRMPLATVNGDVLLTAWGPGGNQVLLLGDLTGHGVPAAVGTVLVTEVFHAMIGRGFSGAEILAEINRKLRMMLPLGYFLAVALVEVTRDQGAAAVWNAGLPDVLFARPGQDVHRIPSRSVPLGVLDADELLLEAEHLALEAGDCLLAFTDGVTEFECSDGGPFGIERVCEVLARQVGGDPVTALLETQARVGATGERQDDVSLFAFRCDPEGVAAHLVAAPTIGRAREPAPWRGTLELGAEALRRIEPVPVILQLLNDVQGSRADRGRVFTVLTELFSNALEHGLLRLDSALKQGPDGFAHYYEERARRLQQLCNARLRLEVGCRRAREGHEVYVCVMHDGDGFDHRAVTAGRALAAHGRGLALVRSLSERLVFRDDGRTAEAVIRTH
jgi:CheY-like chemotaxis protein